MPFAAKNQLHLNLLLQAAQLLTETRLTNVTSLCGTVEMQLLGQSDEAFQRTFVHCAGTSDGELAKRWIDNM
jgi:hypothetical protein